MADQPQPVTREKLINADIDADNLGKAVNEFGVVNPRYGEAYPTLPSAIQTVIETGGFEPFETEAELLESSPTLEKKAAYALDTHKVFLWENGNWINTGLSAKDQAIQKAASLSTIGNYLIETSKREIALLSESSTKYLIAKAIKKVAVTNPISGKKYKIGSVFKNSASGGSRIVINDDTGAVASIAFPAETIVSGVQEYSLTGIRNAKVLIDWDVLPTSVIQSNLELFFDNDKYVQEYSLVANTAQNTVAIDSLKPALLPDWVVSSQANAIASASEDVKKVMNAIKGIDIKGASENQYLRLNTVAKQDATFNTRIYITNDAGIVLLQYRLDNQTPKVGLETLTLTTMNSSGLTGTITINWDEVPTGLLISGPNPLLIKWNAINLSSAKTVSDKNTLDIAALQSAISGVSGASKNATKPYRVAIAGSSITWGQGYLGEGSYVGVVEQILRNQYAKTLHASAIAPTATTLSGNDFYQGSIKRISGLNTEVSFNSDGDELSLSIARERENTGACLVELYVDNVLYDTFDTSTKPSVSRTENFTGNGSTIKFNLEGCFTYNHVVTVGGVAKSGKLATGNTIPSSDDYMVIRRYDSVNNRVVHALWFKEAPTGAVVVTYKQGENIRHLKGTIDHIGAGYSTALEYQYGDGSTAYDPANPTAISSGFGFRESDQRSVKTWKFSESKTRSYKLKIKALHSSATGATPYLDLNFVTNRMHHIMNAGIGGWSAIEFINDTIKLNTIAEVINFNPDVVLIESCTNDDASTGVFKAHVVRSGLTAAQILSEPTANYFTAISGTASNKTVNDVRIPMTAITSNTITLAANVADTSIVVGDVVVIGDYGCNHKRVAVRTIKAYDNATKTITLNRSISADEFYQAESLNDLLSEFVMIYSAPTWVNQVKQLTDMIWSALPDCKINIATAGIPHFYLRKLFGYREIAQKVAKDNHIGFVDYYDATFDYQYSQQLTNHQTITSTGASEYSLTGSAYTFPNPKVFVNGVEHKKFRITGGLTKHWASSVTDPTMTNTSNATKPFKLIFDADMPASGATIVVQKSATAWAADYCHPTGPQGFWVLGQAASKILKDVS